MSDKLNIQDIVDLLVANSDISKEEAERFMVELFSLIEKGLATNELTTIKDFGTFKLTQIEECESVDVSTKEKIAIPAHRHIAFIPTQLLENLVNKP
ncbi:MAG TPA: HU family DNA-binding protein, partial [Dysgonamonadaceae bacterium]|nr:HU family DNA-binding protein [Dysgonamonadaceae bacterium]